MNTNDKNYVDRLHNQQVNELNEIKNRLTILEGKPTSAPTAQFMSNSTPTNSMTFCYEPL